MAEALAQGCADVMQVHYVTTYRDLLGARSLLEERDDAFQRHSRLPDAEHSLRVFVQRRRLPFEGQ